MQNIVLVISSFMERADRRSHGNNSQEYIQVWPHQPLFPFRGQVIPPTGEVRSGGLRVKVDKRPPVPWPQRESLKIEGLDLKERHLLAVVDAHGKTVGSLWFRFTDYNRIHLCISYDGYGGIGLVQDGKHCPRCRCKYTD
jgi:hypothetical protein